MAGKKKARGGRVTESPWAARKAVAKGLVEQFTAAGWEEADTDDVAAINAGELHVSRVCTCEAESAHDVITHASDDHPGQEHAVVITLHDGPPVAVLVRAAS